ALAKGNGFIKDDDGVVFRVQRFNALGSIVKQLVLPADVRKEMVMQAHADCHANSRQLKFLLSDWCWFPKMGNLCRSVSQACGVCQVTASKQGRELAPYGTRRPVEGMAATWQRVGVDVLHVGSGGKLLTCTCWYTAYCDFQIIPDTKAESFVRGMTLVFMRCGFPRVCYSDGEFSSRLVQSWAESVGISWKIHPSNHPEAGGYYERRHRIILEALRKFILSDGGSEWHDELVLEQVKWLVNHGEIGQSGICPALLFYGRTLPVPCMKGADDSLVLSRPSSVFDLMKVADAVDGNRRKLLGVFVKEWLFQRERSLPVIKYESNLKPGEMVYVFTERAHKLSPTFRGPFPVLATRGRHVMVTTPNGVETHWLGNCKRHRSDEDVVADAPRSESSGSSGSTNQQLQIRAPKRARAESWTTEAADRAKKSARM
ncbi:hypothetical protein FOZ63_026333, partial [Perkinsus olseni]